MKIIIPFLFSIFLNSQAFAQSYLELVGLSPNTKYLEFSTEHFHLVYPEGYEHFASRAAYHLEHAHQVLSPILKWAPRHKTDIVIADNEDDANGLTMASLRVGIILIATPPDQWSSTAYTDDWIKLLTFHEYTHMLNLDPTTEWIEAMRILFGDVIRPNGLLPIWMLEGLAVYFETRTSKMGRGRSPYYDSILRALELENRLGNKENRGFTLDRLNGDFPYFPGGETPYLFGYHLWNGLPNDEMMGELSIRSSHRFPYFIEGNLENVTGQHWFNFWDSFIEESHGRLQDQFKKIKETEVTSFETLAHPEYSALGGVISPDGKWLAYNETSLDDLSRLVVKNLVSGKEYRSDQKYSGVGLAFAPDSQSIVYSSLTRTDTYTLYSDLYRFNWIKSKTERLTVASRMKDPAMSPDGNKIVAIASDHATHVLKVLEQGKVSTVYTPTEFGMLGTPKFINNHEVIFSEQLAGQTHSDLKKLDLNSHQVSTLLSNGSMNIAPFYDAKEDRILFSSDVTGIQNIYSLKNGKVSRITNVLTGATFPFSNIHGEVYSSLMTGDGYVIVKYGRSHEISPPKDVSVAEPSAKDSIPEAIAFDDHKSPPTIFDGKKYSPWSSMLPRQWAPIAYVTSGKNSGTSIGGLILGFDATGKQQYLGTGAYHFKTSTWDASFNYSLYFFRPVIELGVSSLTTDIAADTSHAFYRRQTQAVLGLSYPLRFTRSSFVPSVYSFMSWNKIYSVADQSSPRVSDFQYANPSVPGGGASLKFSDAQTPRLGFMPEFGQDVKVALEDRVNGSEYSLMKYIAYYSHYFGLGDHHVLNPHVRWLGSTHPGGLDTTFAQIQGKDKEDSTDRGTTLTLTTMGIRGYPNTLLYTRAVGVFGADYHFPVSKNFFGFDNTFPAFVKQTHGFIFADTAMTVSSRGAKSIFLPSFGGGWSVDMDWFIRAPLRFNFEVQSGTRRDFGGDTIYFLSVESPGFF